MGKGKPKRVAVVSDLHCGHFAGLTPKSRWQRSSPYYHQQKAMWNWYTRKAEEMGPVDLLVCNGDAIDGKGDRAGGTEIFESDRREQTIIAHECLEQIKAKEHRFIYGTPYHTGKDEDWEAVLAGYFGVKPKGHAMFDVHKTTFDIKHKIGSSSVPHGKYTPIAREKIWNIIWAERDGQPSANILIRSHTHSFGFVGDDRYLGVITPGMQGFGAKFGVRQCSGIIHIGFVYFDIYPNGDFEWTREIMKYNLIQEEDGSYEPRLTDK